MYAVKASVSGQEEGRAKVYRRANRQPGLRHQPGCAEPSAGHQQPLRADGGDDHPQRGDRPDGGPHRAHRGRAHQGKRR